MNPHLSDPTQRHLRYHPHKEGGNASRRAEWPDINFNNTNIDIGKFLGVSHQAVRQQRKKRGIPPFTGVHTGRYVP